jgi:hypothetical protein
VAPLAEARELPRLVPWNGGILVVGGGSEIQARALATTEIFDPQSRTWTAGPTLNWPRRDAEVVMLPDGRILAIGGSTGPTKTGSPYVEILGPGGAGWHIAAPMTDPRIGHTSTLLLDGRVLIVGGQADPATFLRSAEIYDPVSDQWSPAPDLNEPRSVNHARLLQSGRVLVIGGGTDVSATSTCELYDPASNSSLLVVGGRGARFQPMREVEILEAAP